MTQLDALSVRALSVLVALQPAAQSAGGGGGGGSSGGHAAGPSGGAGGIMNFIMIPVMFAIVYFVMIRPANKQRQEQESLQKALRKGDRVVTTSGIIGTVVAVESDREVTLEIAEKVRVRFLRDAVTRKVEADAAGDKAPAAKQS